MSDNEAGLERPLIVSFKGVGSQNDSQGWTGVLLRQIGLHGTFLIVELVEKPSGHPLTDTPLEKWEIGIRRAGDKLLLKQSMVMTRVPDIESYRLLVKENARAGQGVEGLVRLRDLNEKLLWRCARRLKRLCHYTRQTRLRENRTYHLALDYPIESTFKPISTYEVSAKRLHRLIAIANQIGEYGGATENALAFQVIDLDTLTCEPMQTPTERQVHRWFHVKDARRGVYRLKKEVCICEPEAFWKALPVSTGTEIRDWILGLFEQQKELERLVASGAIFEHEFPRLMQKWW